ncbi:hypothetical protein AX774_g8017 [Zancudomyces culisetae]|uniref:Uncharacterized protein n=1 Tax=Zancudomyces culisetae TaxID=1213189 RepID=A0A1R1PCE4_ZANCU|nr:hypothetical protein AX774_g8017 [Zancudomyces culisetae]|eukprot:OMH78589.1 hypothetical protein AX774_g8017 [Zancudomyces culisetae]
MPTPQNGTTSYIIADNFALDKMKYDLVCLKDIQREPRPLFKENQNTQKVTNNKFNNGTNNPNISNTKQLTSK